MGFSFALVQLRITQNEAVVARSSRFCRCHGRARGRCQPRVLLLWILWWISLPSWILGWIPRILRTSLQIRRILWIRLWWILWLGTPWILRIPLRILGLSFHHPKHASLTQKRHHSFPATNLNL